MRNKGRAFGSQYLGRGGTTCLSCVSRVLEVKWFLQVVVCLSGVEWREPIIDSDGNERDGLGRESKRRRSGLHKDVQLQMRNTLWTTTCCIC